MRRTPLALIAVVIVAAVPAPGSAAAYPVAQVERQSRENVIRYWTPERMKQAVPAERASRPVLAAKPTKGSEGSAAASAEVPLPYPSAYGKVFFTSNSNVNYVCSGTALASANESVVWTAGHCVNEGPGAFYKNFLFVPAYRDGAAPYGKFAGIDPAHHRRLAGERGVGGRRGRSRGRRQWLRPDPFRHRRGGPPRLQRSEEPGLQALRLSGSEEVQRPADARLPDAAGSLDDTSAAPDSMGASCDMTGGSSGGAWVTSTGAVASVVSYGYSSLRNVLFGPHLESEAQSLYAAASAG